MSQTMHQCRGCQIWTPLPLRVSIQVRSFGVPQRYTCPGCGAVDVVDEDRLEEIESHHAEQEHFEAATGDETGGWHD